MPKPKLKSENQKSFELTWFLALPFNFCLFSQRCEYSGMEAVKFQVNYPQMGWKCAKNKLGYSTTKVSKYGTKNTKLIF